MTLKTFRVVKKGFFFILALEPQFAGLRRQTSWLFITAGGGVELGITLTL